MSTTYATGRRKTSAAKVWVKTGTGIIFVNGKAIKNYFDRIVLRDAVQQPLILCNVMRKYNIYAWVKGGGTTGQAEAIRGGIAKALSEINEKNYRVLLKKYKLLTRDSRMVERKKYGQSGARKKFQYSKR
ncbi:MAG: 30S ribosomal protein S9 [Deltaproteobacteria bacterium]|nr:MAG: 30S ribosomal protein S9 [Deltaproteobacteria bacterium]